MAKSDEELTSVLKAFDKFVGQEVLTQTIQSGEHKGIKISYSDVKDDDKIVKDITTQAAKEGMKLRVWLPKTVGTMDYRQDRINVEVKADSDGKHTVERFYIG